MTTIFVEVTATVSPDYVREVGLPHSQHNLLPWLQSIGDESGTEIMHLDDPDTWQICGSLDCVVKAHNLLTTVTMVTESCSVAQESTEQRTSPVMTRFLTKQKATQSGVRNQPHRSVKKERCTKDMNEPSKTDNCTECECTDLPCLSHEENDMSHPGNGEEQPLQHHLDDPDTSKVTVEDMVQSTVAYKQEVIVSVDSSTQTDDTVWQMKMSPLESVTSPSAQQLEFITDHPSPRSSTSCSLDEILDAGSEDCKVVEPVKVAISVQTPRTTVAEAAMEQPIIHGPLLQMTTQPLCEAFKTGSLDNGSGIHCVKDEVNEPNLPVCPTSHNSADPESCSTPAVISAAMAGSARLYSNKSAEQSVPFDTLPNSSNATDIAIEPDPVYTVPPTNLHNLNPHSLPDAATNGSQVSPPAPMLPVPLPDLQAPISIMSAVTAEQKPAKARKRANSKDTSESAGGETKKPKKYLKIYDSGTCHECGKTFSSMSNMHRHIKIVHQGFRIKCKYCDRTFTSKDTVDRHVRVNHDDLRCTECGLIFESDLTRGDHNCTGQKMESYQCPRCPKNFPAMCNLNKHIRVAHLGQQYDCDMCSKQYKTKHGLLDHFRHAHNIYKCNKCSASFVVESEFVDHVANFHETSSEKSQKKSPVQQAPSECLHCDKKFATPCNLEKHILAYHSQDSLPCERCGKVFANEGQLERHIQMAHTTAQHVCYCGEQFASRKAFARHQTTAHQKQASPTGTYQCDVCGSQFLYESNLNRHINRDHVGIRYPCNVCDKEFKTKVKRQEHEEVEHKGLRFNCGVCPKLFKVKYKLKQHILAHHIGEKYTCDICNKTFVSKEGVQTHQRTQHAEQYKANKTANINGSVNPAPLYSNMQMPAMEDSLEQIQTDFGASLMTALDPNFLPLSPQEASNSNNDLFQMQTYTAILQDTQEFSAQDPSLRSIQTLSTCTDASAMPHNGLSHVDNNSTSMISNLIPPQSGLSHVQTGMKMDAISTIQTGLTQLQPEYTALQNGVGSMCNMASEHPSLANVLAPLDNGLISLHNTLTPLTDGLPPPSSDQQGLNPLLDEITSNQTELTTLQNQVSTLQSALTAIEARLTPLQPVSCGESLELTDKSESSMLSSLLPEVVPTQPSHLADLYGASGAALGMDLDIPASLSQLVSLPYLFVDQTAGSHGQDSSQLATL